MALMTTLDMTTVNTEVVLPLPRSKVAVACITWVSGAGTLIMRASGDGGVTYVTLTMIDPTTGGAITGRTTAGFGVADVSWATHVSIKKSVGGAACVGALNVNYSGGD